MKFKKKVKRVFILSVIAAGVTACSHAPSVQEIPPTANVSEEIQKLGTDLQAAKARQVDALSPHAFEQAQDAFDSAKQDQASQKDSKDVLHDVAQGQAYLSQANEFARLAQTNMEEVVSQRKRAIDAGAPTLFPKDFQLADSHLTQVTSDIEKNDLRSAKSNRSKLLAEYMDIELKSIKQAKVGPAQQKIAQAIKEGAQKYAPQSLAVAEKKVKDTSDFIIANRHDTEGVNARSTDAIASADHLLKITENSKMNKSNSPEEVALRLEAEQQNTQNTASQLQAEKNNVNQLASEKEGLQSEQSFNQKFEAARALFSENEAEVYKQGDKLLIRLKGLEFPVSKALLKGSNFPLLSKVEKVIQSFGKSSVTVEGHTDSTGGKALNQKLSTERAQAVSDYLASSTPEGKIDIHSVGYGYQKPIASNKTVSGKAQNRRVDVVIEPARS